MNDELAMIIDDKADAIERRIQAGVPQDKVLLFGSSFLEEWKTSSLDLAPLETVNIAIGGTRVCDWVRLYQRLVVPFHPRAMVVYVGSNDINGDETSKSGDQVFEEVRAFFARLNQALPGVPVYYLSIAPTIARWHVWHESNRANAQIRDFCAEHSQQYTFIDCTGVLLTDDGHPLPDIFIEDQLHFNDKGYHVWNAVIRPFLHQALL
ncbi:MAG: hypothetical protein JW750_01665 [Anaerolineaceae bacterium]|nr:hypothetical protein [Anaerolineaceae bacterium]